jgi:hypothetical protein
MIGLGELLQIVNLVYQRVVEALRHTLLQEPQDNLGILGVVLVPTVEDRLTEASTGH